MTTTDLEQQIAALQQQYTQHENELLRLRPRARHLKKTLAQLDGAIMIVRGLLQAAQQAAPAPAPASNGVAPVAVPY